MSARKVTRRPKAPPVAQPYFTEYSYGIPIAGPGSPLPCPFYASTKISIVIGARHEGSSGYGTAHAHCDNCGAEMGYSNNMDGGSHADAVMEAARLWNTRPSATEAQP